MSEPPRPAGSGNLGCAFMRGFAAFEAGMFAMLVAFALAIPVAVALAVGFGACLIVLGLAAAR